MADEVAEVPAAPGKRCPAGRGRGWVVGVKFEVVIAAGHRMNSVAGVTMGRCLCPCGSAQAALAPWSGTVPVSLLLPSEGFSSWSLRTFAAVSSFNVCVVVCGVGGCHSPISGSSADPVFLVRDRCGACFSEQGPGKQYPHNHEQVACCLLQGWV